jgi:hypothetical protein
MSLSFHAVLIKGRNGRDLYLASSDNGSIKKEVMLLMVEQLNSLTFNLNCFGVQVFSVSTSFFFVQATPFDVTLCVMNQRQGNVK